MNSILSCSPRLITLDSVKILIRFDSVCKSTHLFFVISRFVLLTYNCDKTKRGTPEILNVGYKIIGGVSLKNPTTTSKQIIMAN